MKPIVTRFAPSPTGFMHIGGVRTALFAYLLARKNAGTFILRIEDTDKEREVPGSIQHIQDSLSWLGIDWDYGPDKTGPFGSCIQSERLPIYRKYAEELIKKGLAYPDPYTTEEIAGFRAQAEALKKPFLYRNHRPSVDIMSESWDGTKALRLKIPTIARLHWHDAVRGDLEAGEEALDDFIIIKSDGYPTYNFAHIVDDKEMNVTHILRGEEFISSTPKYLSLYEALGITPPIFATLPSILRDDKTKKLGKRDGAKDILDYRTDGYLPEAMVNILALVGWNPGTEQELFSMDELKRIFDLDKVQKSGGVFNEEKLDWFNKQYIAKLSDIEFTNQIKKYIPEWLDTSGQKINSQFNKILPLIREKIVCYADISKLFDREGELSFIRDITDYPASMLLWKKNPDPILTSAHLTEARKLLGSILASDSSTDITAEMIKNTLWPYVEAHGKGDVLWPLRVAITGQEKSPDPFVSISFLNNEEILKRIDTAIIKLAQLS